MNTSKKQQKEKSKKTKKSKQGNSRDVSIVKPEERAVRPTMAIYAKRKIEVKKLLLQGAVRAEIIQFTAERYGVKERSADLLIATCQAEINEINKKTTEEMIAFVVHNYLDILKRCKLSGELGVAIQALDRISKIKGLERNTMHHFLHKAPEELAGIDENVIEAEFENESDD